MKHKIRQIYFVGIGGVGMSGIAEVLHSLGYIVIGSDIVSNYNTERLSSIGIKVIIGHIASNICGSDVVVTSSAVTQLNPEVKAAFDAGIPVVPRAMMLAELMRFKYGIAIAGTHGKTTTTSLAAEVLSQCKLDPTFIIGGKLAVTESNAKIGGGEYLIAEADESDASFLYLSPLIAVVTNIDYDHMDTYDHDEKKLKQIFIDFLHRLPFYGRAILCNEDANVREIIRQVERPIITYGLSSDSDIYAIDIVAKNTQMEYTVCIKNGENEEIRKRVTLNLPGEHNVLNSLAVIALGLECEGKLDDIAIGLSKFHGVGRRCQKYSDLVIGDKTAILIDDYAHHPSELKATIAALKNAYPNKRMVLVFQPHRYTRTRDLFDDFVTVLSNVDQLIVLEVYAASEKPIALADGRSLVKAIRSRGAINTFFAKDFVDAKKILTDILKDGDLVVTMGAGSIGKFPQQLLSEIK